MVSGMPHLGSIDIGSGDCSVNRELVGGGWLLKRCRRVLNQHPTISRSGLHYGLCFVLEGTRGASDSSVIRSIITYKEAPKSDQVRNVEWLERK
jgi:hypothetical protein